MSPNLNLTAYSSSVAAKTCITIPHNDRLGGIPRSDLAALAQVVRKGCRIQVEFDVVL